MKKASKQKTANILKNIYIALVFLFLFIPIIFVFVFSYNSLHNCFVIFKYERFE